ncbi:MAG: V-type ATPase 116kDa subunit family protein [Treponema sp.]|nr:V-type ATPase 116kDa subunit family protein [Treponema sp.]
MIVPMKKVSLVVLNNERKDALTQLKKVGVVHLEQIDGSSEQLSLYKEASNNAVAANAILSDIKVAKKKSFSSAVKTLSNDEVVAKCKHVIDISDKKKKLLEEIASDAAEIERFANWGQVDIEDFAFLKEKGISFKMYEIPEDKYNLIDEKVTTICVNRIKKIVRFLLIDASEDRPEGLPPEAFEVPMPVLSTKDLAKRVEDNEAEISKIEEELKSETVYISQIQDFKSNLESDIQFETIYSGMGQENSGKTTDLAWLTGYVPVDSFDKLKDCVTKNSWAMAASDPTEEDNVPTKLKNNKFVSLIYPLTDFLGTVPGYHEYDISGWFLLFFCVFFGMIFGDGGYGLLVTIASLVLVLKSLFQKKSVSPLMGLLLLLGLSTVAWGTVTCTWFGLKPEQLPAWLTSLSITPISNAAGSDYRLYLPWNTEVGLTTGQNLQIFCFTLAFLQLSVAHLKGMARNRKSLKVLGEFGSLLQIWGMFYVVLSMVVSSALFPLGLVVNNIPVGTIAIALVGGGFALSFIFSNYEGNIGASILESCKNIISVLLGVVNVFSDIVSYIRLWAVGLAGSAISNTVNEMAGPLLGHAITFIAFVALIAFGHGLNMVLNLLSVIVHGVRLNTLEFSTHLGMSWSGFKYNPFAEKENK